MPPRPPVSPPLPLTQRTDLGDGVGVLLLGGCEVPCLAPLKWRDDVHPGPGAVMSRHGKWAVNGRYTSQSWALYERVIGRVIGRVLGRAMGESRAGLCLAPVMCHGEAARREELDHPDPKVLVLHRVDPAAGRLVGAGRVQQRRPRGHVISHVEVGGCDASYMPHLRVGGTPSAPHSMMVPTTGLNRCALRGVTVPSLRGERGERGERGG